MASNPRVYNKYHQNAPEDAIFIGRPSKWGNPYKIGRDGSRIEVVEKYRKWLQGQPELIAAVKRELAGRDLVCFCAPRLCHGHVLVEIANAK